MFDGMCSVSTCSLFFLSFCSVVIDSEIHTAMDY
jgi:hypothetical protein